MDPSSNHTVEDTEANKENAMSFAGGVQPSLEVAPPDTEEDDTKCRVCYNGVQTMAVYAHSKAHADIMDGGYECVCMCVCVYVTNSRFSSLCYYHR